MITMKPGSANRQWCLSLTPERAAARLEEAIALRFGMEIAPVSLSEEDTLQLKRIASALKSEGLPLSLHSGLPDYEGALPSVREAVLWYQARARSEIELALKLDVQTLVVHALCHPSLDLRCNLRSVDALAEVWRGIYEEMDLASQGVKICFENANRGRFSVEIICRLLDLIPEASCCIDVCHWQLSMNYRDSAGMFTGEKKRHLSLASRCSVLHLSESNGKTDTHEYPGRFGLLDWPQLTRRHAASIDTNCRLVLELHQRRPDYLPMAAKARESIDGWLDEALISCATDHASRF